MAGKQVPALGGTQDVFFPRSTLAEIPTIVAGEGVYLVDDAGQRLLDVCSGPFLASLGQGNERVLEAMLAQGRPEIRSFWRSRCLVFEVAVGWSAGGPAVLVSAS